MVTTERYQEHYQAPSWSSVLRTCYWRLRQVRPHQQAERRKWYRYARAERNVLEAAGIDGEWIRLLCRHLADPTCQQTLDRLRVRETEVAMDPSRAWALEWTRPRHNGFPYEVVRRRAGW